MIHLSDSAPNTEEVWAIGPIGTCASDSYDWTITGLAMNLSGFEIQIMFCVLILLGLLSVALVVDYLKGMNEKLRERHVDLLARHETAVNRIEDDNARLLRALAEQSKAFRDMTKRQIIVSNFPKQDRALENSSEQIARIAVAPHREAIVEVAPMADMTEAELEAQVLSFATVPDLKIPQTEEAVTAPQPVEEQIPPNVIRFRLTPEPNLTLPTQEENKESRSALESRPLELAELKENSSAEPDFDGFLEQLVTEFESSPVLDEHATSIEALAQMVESKNPTKQEIALNLPISQGSHPPAALNQLLERKELLRGLVVAIGINDYLKLDEMLGHSTAEMLLNSVENLMESVATSNGFCSRRSDDEFVLIFPELNGTSAQQRLSEISEQLWDYQLQTLGTYSVVFSWGASEAQNQPLAEALLIASENMAETRNSRKSAASDRSRRQRATA